VARYSRGSRFPPLLGLLGLLTIVSTPRCLAGNFTDSFEGASFDLSWNRTGPGLKTIDNTVSRTGGQSARLATSSTYPWNAYLSQYFPSEYPGSVSVFVHAALTSASADLQIHLDNGGWANLQQLPNGEFWARICPVASSSSPLCLTGVFVEAPTLFWHKFEIVAAAKGITVKLDGSAIATDPSITRFRSFGFEVWGAPDGGMAYYDDLTVAVGAQTYDLAPPGTVGSLEAFVTNALGNSDRNVVFDVETDVAITSAGVRIDPLVFGVTALRVDIWEVTPGGGYLDLGTRAATPLKTATAQIMDLGLNFYHVPIEFTFQAGRRYAVGFSQAGPTPGWGTNTAMEFYNFGLGEEHDPPYRDNQVFTIGSALTVLNGGFGSDLAQRSLPHVRLTGEPAQ